MSPDNLYLLLSLRGALTVALSAFLSLALSAVPQGMFRRHSAPVPAESSNA